MLDLIFISFFKAVCSLVIINVILFSFISAINDYKKKLWR